MDGKKVSLTGIAKGSGMIRPDMATMLSFIFTDIGASQQELQDCLSLSINQSFNRITIERFTGLDFNSDIQINSNEAIVEAVQAGLGIGFVSKHSVNLQLKNNIIKQLDVSPFPIIRQWHIVHHAEAELSPIARRFKQFVIDNAQFDKIK